VNDRTLTLLFRRYREKGDGRALAAVFDACAKPLLELACHLVRDPSEAEDLVQATFLAAIRRAERYDEGAPLQAWLYGILWREAARARRSAARRVDPARLAERTAPDPAELAAASEVPAAVGAALAKLPRPYREVLEPLLFEEQRAERIARELARSAGTVRSQIHRGLEELRRALAPRFAAHGALLLPTRGLLRVRASVLEAAGVAPTTAATAPAAVLLLTLGGALVSKTALAVSAAVIVSVGGTWLVAEQVLREGEPAGETGARAALARGPSARASAELALSSEPESAASAPAARSESTPQAAPEPTLEERVRYWRARFDEAPEDWRHGWSVAAEIAALSPEEARAIMEAVWPHLSVPVKEQVLKPFVFGGHPYALPILRLAVNDPASSVQGRAFTYLEGYAFRDFSLDYEACLAWLAREGERPLADVLRENARAFTAELLALSPAALTERMLAFDDLDLRAGTKLGLDLAAEIRAAGGERILETALASPEGDVVRTALEWSRTLRVDERWLRTWVLPILGEADPGRVSAAFRALERPDCGWARDEVLAFLGRATLTKSHGTRGAARVLAEIGDPAAIPAMIALLLRDQTGALAYDVGHFGLARLTGVNWQESYDTAWWLEWWEKNRARFPAEVAAQDVR
jgi:RNA polymerase sigma-70 factor (ECF subfamily)